MPQVDYTSSGRSYQTSDRGRMPVFFGIDSDGCVDNGMRYKHGGPFPAAVSEYFRMEPVEEQLRLAWTFVNEFEDRGCPRFTALAKAMGRLAEMPSVQEFAASGKISLPDMTHLRAYLNTVAKERGFGDEVLASYIATLTPGSPEQMALQQVAEWSILVNHKVDTQLPRIPPFPNAVASINTAYEKGVDMMIVSGTPEKHLRREWEHHGLLDKVRGVYGRDTGKKADLLTAAVQASRSMGLPYSVAIMFGDAPGDDKERKKASESIGQEIGFMPIRVGYENADWAWFLENFIGPGEVHKYTGSVEEERVAEFYRNLDREWLPGADITSLFPKRFQ